MKKNTLENIGSTVIGTIASAGSVVMIAKGESAGYLFLPISAIILYQGVNGLRRGYQNQRTHLEEDSRQ